MRGICAEHHGHTLRPTETKRNEAKCRNIFYAGSKEHVLCAGGVAAKTANEEENDCSVYIMSCRKINNITLIKGNVCSSQSRRELVASSCDDVDDYDGR